MKSLLFILFLFFVSSMSAQDVSKVRILKNNTEEKVMRSNASQDFVISVKGIKTMEEIDIENYNKSSYLNLITVKQQKPKMC